MCVCAYLCVLECVCVRMGEGGMGVWRMWMDGKVEKNTGGVASSRGEL